MELRYFYTPKYRYTLCTGMSVTSSELRQGEPLFFYQVNGKRIASAINLRGAAGLQRVIETVRAKGYVLPDGVGEAVSWNLTYIKLYQDRVELRPPYAVRQNNPRIAFQLGTTHGSFNRAVQSALRTLEVYNRLREGRNDCLRLLDELEDEGKLNPAQLAEYRRIKLEA